MNKLDIKKEVKRVEYVYTTELFKYEGTCEVSVDNTVSDVSASVYTKDTGISIGNCSSNGSTNVNIYSTEYKQNIDLVAHEFKTLQADLDTKYAASNFNEEIL